MAEHTPNEREQDEKPDEEGDLGDPAQTGPGDGEGMGTKEGSGWEPDEHSGEDVKVDPDEPLPAGAP